MLKAKKISGTEGSLDETLTDDISDEEEMTNHEAESLSAEEPPAGTLNHDGKVSLILYGFSINSDALWCLDLFESKKEPLFFLSLSILLDSWWEEHREFDQEW